MSHLILDGVLRGKRKSRFHILYFVQLIFLILSILLICFNFVTADCALPLFYPLPLLCVGSWS